MGNLFNQKFETEVIDAMILPFFREYHSVDDSCAAEAQIHNSHFSVAMLE